MKKTQLLKKTSAPKRKNFRTRLLYLKEKAFKKITSVPGKKVQTKIETTCEKDFCT